MTTLPPDEALHFRGETLTPESPRPLHVAEPANIPVLENQMDPVFNDTSTYKKQESGQKESYHSYHADGRLSYTPYTTSTNDGWVDAGGNHSTSVQGQDPGNFHSFSLQKVDGSRDMNHSTTEKTTTTNFSDGQAAAPTANQQQPASAVAETSTLPDDAANNQILSASSPSVHHHHHQYQQQQQQQQQNNASAAVFLAQAISKDSPRNFSEILDSRHNNQTLGASVTAGGGGEVDTPATTAWATPPTTQGHLESQDRKENNGTSADPEEGGVDFENLLNNLSHPLATASSAPTVAATAPSSVDDSNAPQNTTADSLLTASGLPPRPPPQEKFSINPKYPPSDDIRSYHHLPSQNSSNTPKQYANHQSNYHAAQGSPYLSAAGAPGTSSGANALPPPPLASFQHLQQPSMDSPESLDQSKQKNGRIDKQPGRQLKPDEDVPWGPEVQKKYDEFLSDERVYVTEGLWDRFPPGSRLFVGNLPTERVTKRDLFHIFHKYGKLAQISIKQAYGFIQFLAATSCYRALQAEQGAVVRGRKIHLEISKPQRNTRPGPPLTDPPPRGSHPVRSRSPEYPRIGPNPRNARGPPGDRYDRPLEPARLPFSDFRDEHTHRRRDDYRPPRTPSPRVSPRLSPRSYRGRDDYRSRDRDKTPPERYDRRDRRRSRSPYIRDRRYRSPSPRPRNMYENDFDLPVPRRIPRDVPDVQILVLDDVGRNFVFHVENCFRSRGLRVDVLTLGPRIPLSAAVNRQINEGVRAIARLSRSNQFSGKVSLQIIDRTGGPGNVRFNDYPDLEIGIATEVIFHSQSVQRGSAPAPFPISSPFGVPPITPVSVPQPPLPALSTPPNIANLITSFDVPTLHSILATLQQQQQPVPTAQQPFPAANLPQGAELVSLLNNAARQPHPIPPMPAAPPHPHLAQRLPLQPPNAPVVPDPNLLSLLAKSLGQQPQNQTATGPNVQSIMNQLAKWKQ